MSVDDPFAMARELAKKLNQDRKILEKYNTKENQIAYKTNEYIFNWLKFDYYNMRLIMSRIDEEAFEDGWFVWMNDMSIEVFGIEFKTMDEKRAYTYEKYFDYSFKVLFGQNDFLDESIQCFKNEKYYACACLLFTNMEYLERQITNFNPSDKFVMSAALKQRQTQDVVAFSDKYYKEFEEKMNEFLKNNYYAQSTASDPEPEVINRNRIMHGILTRKVSKIDCLKMFVLVKSMFLFNDWLNCYRQMKEISAYLDSNKTNDKQLVKN